MDSVTHLRKPLSAGVDADPWEEMEAAGTWLLELEERFRPDVIHLNGYSQAALPWRAPVLVVAHSCVLSWWQAVHGSPRRRSGRATRNTCGQESMPPAWSSRRPPLCWRRSASIYGQPREARVIHNCADPARFVPSRKEPFIFAAGRLGDHAKNIATLAESRRRPSVARGRGRRGERRQRRSPPAAQPAILRTPYYGRTCRRTWASLHLLPACALRAVRPFHPGSRALPVRACPRRYPEPARALGRRRYFRKSRRLRRACAPHSSV